MSAPVPTLLTVDDLAPPAVMMPEAVRPSVGEPRLRPTRILVVAFQVGRQADGGVESLTQLVEGYAGLRVTLLSQAETAKNRRWRQAGARVLVWPLADAVDGPSRRGFLSRLWQHVHWNVRTAWLCVSERIEVAHVNDHHALWHTALGLRLLGIPIVYNIRDTKPHVTPREVRKWRTAFFLTQAQIVLSREMRAFWRRVLAIRGEKLVAIYSVVDFQRLRPVTGPGRAALRRRLGLPPSFVVGYVASFSEKKAQLRFIERAGPELQRRAPGIQVCFLGDFDPARDPYALKCEQAAHALDLTDRFDFRGYVAEMDAWYPALDLVVVATQNEGLARCMIESLACGTPVVSFDVCSAREILEPDDCGVVVPQGDYTALISALIMFASDETDRAARGQRGVRLARQRFDRAGNAAQYLAIYESLAGAGSLR